VPSNKNEIGVRLSRIRKEALLTLDALSSISQISKSTLSRIENGSTSFEYSHIKVLADVFGMTELDFQNPKSEIPNFTQSKSSILKFIKKKNLQISSSEIYRKKTRTSFFVDKMIESDFLKGKEKTMKEIVEYCNNEFGVSLVGSDISNILKRKKKAGLIVIVKKEDYNGFYYSKK